jgi:hypothetical protein
MSSPLSILNEFWSASPETSESEWTEEAPRPPTGSREAGEPFGLTMHANLQHAAVRSVWLGPLLLLACGSSPAAEPPSQDPGRGSALATAGGPAEPEIDAYPADCAGGQTIFRCAISPEGQAGARLCLHDWGEGLWLTGSLRPPDGPPEAFAQRLSDGPGSVGLCRYSSPHQSHEATFVGSPSRRLLVRAMFVNPAATEFHGQSPATLPDQPAWDVYSIDAGGERSFSCQGQVSADLLLLESYLDITAMVFQAGCEGFGQEPPKPI